MYPLKITFMIDHLKSHHLKSKIDHLCKYTKVYTHENIFVHSTSTHNGYFGTFSIVSVANNLVSHALGF